MASYKKYAEDLIGGWETGQYEPQRNVTQNIYQTNWTKLSNDFNTLKDKLARNFSNAQMEYANTLNDVQNQSFNRMRNADIDLATRGLSTSGVGNLITQADTQQKGQDIDRALSGLLDTNRGGIEDLTSGVINLGQKQSSLAGDLAGDLGKITDQEAQNAQQYANLVAGIGENAAQRAAARASRGGGGSSKKSKKEQQDDEIKRRLLIADTIAAQNLSDAEKKQYLNEYLDVPVDTANSVIDAYNTNKTIQADRGKLQNFQDRLQRQSDRVASLSNYPAVVKYAAMAPVRSTSDSINRLQNELNNLTYQDIYEMLYGR